MQRVPDEGMFKNVHLAKYFEDAKFASVLNRITTLGDCLLELEHVVMHSTSHDCGIPKIPLLHPVGVPQQRANLEKATHSPPLLTEDQPSPISFSDFSIFVVRIVKLISRLLCKFLVSVGGLMRDALNVGKSLAMKDRVQGLVDGMVSLQNSKKQLIVDESSDAMVDRFSSFASSCSARDASKQHIPSNETTFAPSIAHETSAPIVIPPLPLHRLPSNQDPVMNLGHLSSIQADQVSFAVTSSIASSSSSPGQRNPSTTRDVCQYTALDDPPEDMYRGINAESSITLRVPSGSVGGYNPRGSMSEPPPSLDRTSPGLSEPLLADARDSRASGSNVAATTDMSNRFSTHIPSLLIPREPKTYMNSQYESGLRLKHVDVFNPAGLHLLSSVSFELKPGKSLLIQGPSGSGRSSLVRVIAGLWPVVNNLDDVCSNEGSRRHPKIFRPPTRQLFFLPQKVYLTDGTLRQQIAYPCWEPAVIHDLDDAMVEYLMLQCNLSSLFSEHHEQLDDTEKDWRKILSPGEQQRLSFCRLLWHYTWTQKSAQRRPSILLPDEHLHQRRPEYKPFFAVLDEATSAMDTISERMCYQALCKTSIGYVSVCHRTAGKKYHTRVMSIVGDQAPRILVEADHSHLTDRSVARKYITNQGGATKWCYRSNSYAS